MKNSIRLVAFLAFATALTVAEEARRFNGVAPPEWSQRLADLGFR